MSLLSEDVFLHLEGGEKDECPKGYPDRCFTAWMSFVSGSVRVIDTVIPGSHDCATYSMRNGSPTDAYAQTQEYNLTAQLLFGVRYFDLRCTDKDGNVVINHGPVTGRRLCTILSQIKSFLIAVPGETVLLDFQELNKDCEEKTAQMITQYFQESCIVPSSQVTKDLTFDVLRREGYRLIIFWNSGDLCGKPWLTPRSRLWSPYNESVYKGSTDKIPAYLDERCEEWKARHSGEFFVAQAISTTTISTPRQIEKRDGHILNGWVKEQTAGSGVNIIMRDFVNWYPSTIGHIIRLNLERGSISADYKQLFDLFHCAKQEYRKTQKSVTFELGVRGYPGSKPCCKDTFSRPWQFLKHQTHLWRIACPEGCVVTWFKITSNWTDGTNGTFTIEKGNILDGILEVSVSSELSRGCNWTIEAEMAPFTADSFYRNK